ncbi:DUF5675 family protein [Algoriphagus vanfongensis]|uniref:DUF5675 family protein n=1 Tax=Algoriphagus vanfongensis TaxID=426371 RepID=UPI00047CCC7E|nr:DUF5675 family protein [Algoriphagus vanfongensis]
MKIILDREYWPTSTHGRIMINDDFICHTLEPPKVPGIPKDSCLPEGSYLLAKEDQIPLLTLKKSDKGEFLGVICSQTIFKVHLPQIIIPVISINSEGKGSKPSLAFQRLLKGLEVAIKAGEAIRLEIRSCPDKALNLAFSSEEWMD